MRKKIENLSYAELSKMAREAERREFFEAIHALLDAGKFEYKPYDEYHKFDRYVYELEDDEDGRPVITCNINHRDGGPEDVRIDRVVLKSDTLFFHFEGEEYHDGWDELTPMLDEVAPDQLHYVTDYLYNFID